MAGQFFFVTLEHSLHNPQQFAEYARNMQALQARLTLTESWLRQETEQNADPRGVQICRHHERLASRWPRLPERAATAEQPTPNIIDRRRPCCKVPRTESVNPAMRRTSIRDRRRAGGLAALEAVPRWNVTRVDRRAALTRNLGRPAGPVHGGASPCGIGRGRSPYLSENIARVYLSP